MEGVARVGPGIGEVLELAMDALDGEGECLGSLEGRAVHVFGGIPGERVTAEVVRSRRGHVAARVVGAREPSPDRVSPPCPYFWPCTGCQWQHISYPRQLDLKRRLVGEALASFPELEGVPVAPVAPSPREYGYRNHARFTVGPGGSLGFVNRTTRRFLRVDRCLLMDEGINQALEALQGLCAETTALSVRHGTTSGELLVQPRLLDPRVAIPTGQGHYSEEVLGRRFRIASPSFFQVNTLQMEEMVRRVKEALALSGGELVVDAYAGVGTFAALLAPFCGRVVAVEESAAAVRDARANAQGLAGVELRQGRVEDVLPALGERLDAVVLDPPRAGCHRRVLDALVRLGVPRVAYVSCEPSALARDLAVLASGPYRVERVQPIDLFPQTHHVECIATLSLRPPAGAGRVELVLASASPRRRELLEGLGVVVRAVPSGVDERSGGVEEDPVELARGLALRKARAVAARVGGGTVLGADTVVALQGRVLGKPASREDALWMLEGLRGREHLVVTAVALVDAPGGGAVVDHQETRVVMRRYADAEVAAFVDAGLAWDKAGAYAIQDPDLRPASRVDGCYTSVMGLPLGLVARLLEGRGVRLQPPEGWVAPGGCLCCRALEGGGREG